MQNVSADLVWQCTKKYNSFLVKRDGVTLTAEPGNPTNVHGLKYSGLGAKKSIDVRATKDQIVLNLRKVKDQNKPAKAVRQIKINSADPNRVIKAAKKVIADAYYRPGAFNVVNQRIAKLAQATVRAHKLSAGKLKVRYGRNAKFFPFTSKGKESTTGAASKAEDEDLPALTGGEAD